MAGFPEPEAGLVISYSYLAHDPNVAVEIPLRVKEHLGLDSERSWVILEEINIFTWPGFDLRPIKKSDSRVDYGLLPPKLFERLIEKFRELRAQGKIEAASRDEPMQAVPAKSSLGSKR